MSRRWHVMLKWDVYVMRAQWPFVRGSRCYRDAYDDGLRRIRARYGERALWQMVADGRSGQWTQVFKAFWVLLRYYPAGLVNLFKSKALKLFFIRRLGSS
jgi:hypothetical protein